MIPKYSRPEMAAIWSDKGKYDRWLQVEIAVCDAWAERGDIPKEAAEKIRNARYNLDDFERYLKEIHHDVISFLRTVADSLGEEGRYVHMGLTSYDVVDTALGMQLRDATDIIQRDLAALIAVIEERAREHKYTLMMGRTHGVHAEPITFGLKLASWVDELRRHQRHLADARTEVAVGKVSGPVGSHATVPPEIEEAVCARLGLGVEPISTQIVHRDRHARFLTTLAILAVFSRQVRDRGPASPAHRGPGGGGAVREGAGGLQRHAAQAQPGEVRARLRPRPRRPRLRPDVAGERRPLARARPHGLVAGADHPARRLPPASTTYWTSSPTS